MPTFDETLKTYYDLYSVAENLENFLRRRSQFRLVTNFCSLTSYKRFNSHMLKKKGGLYTCNSGIIIYNSSGGWAEQPNSTGGGS